KMQNAKLKLSQSLFFRGRRLRNCGNWGLAVGLSLNVGTGALDGPSPFDQESLSGKGYFRTVGDAGPYGFIFKLTAKPKLEA
ncbi:MAG: hypothetical protein J6M42_01820, partial [Clostridia bacterium]|nr:hypothetical protein [Clostridia bacterium]